MKTPKVEKKSRNKQNDTNNQNQRSGCKSALRDWNDCHARHCSKQGKRIHRQIKAAKWAVMEPNPPRRHEQLKWNQLRTNNHGHYLSNKIREKHHRDNSSSQAEMSATMLTQQTTMEITSQSPTISESKMPWLVIPNARIEIGETNQIGGLEGITNSKPRSHHYHGNKGVSQNNNPGQDEQASDYADKETRNDSARKASRFDCSHNTNKRVQSQKEGREREKQLRRCSLHKQARFSAYCIETTARNTRNNIRESTRKWLWTTIERRNVTQARERKKQLGDAPTNNIWGFTHFQDNR